jgi:phosphoribosyl 1,2-cyclic phosphodiesterase
MRATVWGCRGSLARPGPETVVYGGNTSCLSLELSDGTPVVLDAGTGILRLGAELANATPRPIHLFLTHLHFDHIEGLGLFEPLWTPGREIHFWGPPSPVAGLSERIARYFSPPLFPIQLLEVPAQLVFHDLPEQFSVGSSEVLALPVSHRGPTVGFRVSDDGHTLAYIPDHEPYLGYEPGEVEPDWLSGHGLAERADTLVHDAQYFEDEYQDRRGFGHSSLAHAVAFAQACAAERLVLFHHDPKHTDADLERLQARARELWGGEGHLPELARDGMQLGVKPRTSAW